MVALQEFIKKMSNLAPFPNLRMRRMRRDEFSRRLMRENILSVDDLTAFPGLWVSISTSSGNTPR